MKSIYPRIMLKFFSSPTGPNELVKSIKSIVDEEEIDPANPSLFTGERPVIGRFADHRFKLQRRVQFHWLLWRFTPGQWFKPYLNGTVTGDSSGSRVELEGSTPIVTKIIWVLALLGASSLIGAWTVFSYPYNISHDPAYSASEMLGGIILLNLVGAILVVLPIIGWMLTRHQLAEIVRELRNHLELKETAFSARTASNTGQDHIQQTNT